MGLPVVVVLAGIVGLVAALTGGDDDATVRTSQSTVTTAATSSTDVPGGQPATTVTTTAGSVAAPTTVGTAPEQSVTTTTPAATPGGARVQVKFVDGSGVRLRDGRLVSETGQDLSALDGVLADYPGVTIERLFQRPEEDLAAERAAAEARTGLPQPDLNLYYRLTVAEGVDASGFIGELEGVAVVDRAYLDPGAAPPPG